MNTKVSGARSVTHTERPHTPDVGSHAEALETQLRLAHPPTEQTLRSSHDPNMPRIEVIMTREQDATPNMPLTYREYAFLVPPGTPDAAIENLLMGRFYETVGRLFSITTGKIVNLAVFDVPFRNGKPLAKPLATLSWKDWQDSKPKIQYHGTRTPSAGTEVLSQPPFTPLTGAQPSLSHSAPGPNTSVSPFVEAAPEKRPDVLASKGIGPRLFARQVPPEPTVDSMADPSVLQPALVRPPPPVAQAPHEPQAWPQNQPQAWPQNHQESGEPQAMAPSPSAEVPPPVVAEVPPPVVAEVPVLPSPLSASVSQEIPIELGEPIDASMLPAAAVPAFVPPPPPVAREQTSHAPPSGASERKSSRPPPPPSTRNKRAKPSEIVTPKEIPALSSAPGDVVRDPFASSAPRQVVPQSVPPQFARRPAEDLLTDLFVVMHEMNFLPSQLEASDFCLRNAVQGIPVRIAMCQFFDMNRREFVVVRAYTPQADAPLLFRTSEKDPVLREVMMRRRPVLYNRAATDPRLQEGRWAYVGEPVVNALLAPLMQGGRFLGVIELANTVDGQPFSESEAEAIHYIATQFSEYLVTHGVMLDPEIVRAFRPFTGA